MIFYKRHLAFLFFLFILGFCIGQTHKKTETDTIYIYADKIEYQNIIVDTVDSVSEFYITPEKVHNLDYFKNNSIIEIYFIPIYYNYEAYIKRLSHTIDSCSIKYPKKNVINLSNIEQDSSLFSKNNCIKRELLSKSRISPIKLYSEITKDSTLVKKHYVEKEDFIVRCKLGKIKCLKASSIFPYNPIKRNPKATYLINEINNTGSKLLFLEFKYDYYYVF